MGEIEELREALKQVNRRLINAEASLRMLEKRIDAAESLIRVTEEKAAVNAKKIFQLEKIEDFVSKKDFEALRKYIGLINHLDAGGSG